MSNPPTFDLITSIKELQGLEEYMFQQLESINMNDPNNISQQNDIIKHINDLSDLRNDLFGQLGKMYVNLDKNSQIERSALTDQITTTNMMEQQLNNLKNDVQIILDQRTDKMRMVEIGEYEYLRYSMHKYTMKLIAFTSLAILVFSYTLKNRFLPVQLSKAGILASCAIGGVLIVKAVWEMVSRDNQNYNRFIQPNIPAGGGVSGSPDTVWGHDKKFLSQIIHGIEDEGKKGWNDLKGAGANLWSHLSAAEQLAKNEAHCKLDFTPAQQWSPQLNKCVPTGSQEGFRVVRGFEDKNSLRSAPFN